MTEIGEYFICGKPYKVGDEVLLCGAKGVLIGLRDKGERKDDGDVLIGFLRKNIVSKIRFKIDTNDRRLFVDFEDKNIRTSSLNIVK